MKKIVALTVIVCVMAVVDVALAELVRGINIDFVSIGNAGNDPDTQIMITDGTSGYGAVNYNYRIGKYEVTNAQWNAFTSVAGLPTGNPSNAYDLSARYTGAHQPTNNVSWYEAAQFCNYLTSGNKSLGAYLLGTDGSITVDRNSAISTYGTVYVIPTEDEWYKAAYHKNDGVTGNYWLYPTQSNIEPSNDLINPDPGNNANFHDNDYTIGQPDLLTVVGEFENSESAYGTFDQGGNVWEWTETLINGPKYGSIRGLRGGSATGGDNTGFYLASSYRLYDHTVPYDESDEIGFRVASIPEPCSLLLIGLGGLVLRRK